MPLFEFWSLEQTNCVSIPDIHFQCQLSGISGWLELKYIRPGDKTLKYQKGQPSWISKYAKRGGHAFVVAIDKHGTLLLLKGERAFSTQFVDINELHWDGKHVAKDGQPDWAALATHILDLISL